MIRLIIAGFFVVVMVSSAFSQERLSLEEAFEIALRQNYGIEIARKNFEISQTQNHPGNAGLLPRVGFQTGLNYSSNNSRQELFDGTIRSVEWAGNFSFNTGVQATYTLYDGGGGRNQKMRLDRLENLSAQQIEVIARDMLSRLSRVFYTVIYFRDSEDYILESIRFFEELEELEQERLELGRGTRLNLLQTQTELNRERARLEQVISMREIAMQDLFRLMNTEPFDVLPDAEGYFDEEEVELENLLADVLINNPEVVFETIQQFVLESDLEISRAFKLPTIELNAGIDYNYTLSEVGIFQSNRNYGPFIGATARFNIFDGHRSRKEIQVNQLRLEVGAMQLADLRSELETETRKRYLEFQNSGRLLEIERENLELARQNLELAEEMFLAGRINNFELREVQQQLVRGEEAIANVRRNRALAYIDLMALAGEFFVD
ncbi:MAG: TolC family protein [Saprospirales bacterium]|nr:MAG: TolC family protein [Saprospirales bacterium]